VWFEIGFALQKYEKSKIQRSKDPRDSKIQDGRVGWAGL
jgi:hypothetical protein